MVIPAQELDRELKRQVTAEHLVHLLDRRGVRVRRDLGAGLGSGRIWDLGIRGSVAGSLGLRSSGLGV